MNTGPTSRECTIQGIVTASAWDQEYNVVAVKIAVAGEEEFLVEQNPRGRELLAHLREVLSITGRLRDDGAGNKIITVDRFERINP